MEKEIHIMEVQQTNSYDYGPDNLRNVSDSSLNLCHEELWQYWRQRKVQSIISKLYLIQCLLAVSYHLWEKFWNCSPWSHLVYIYILKFFIENKVEPKLNSLSVFTNVPNKADSDCNRSALKVSCTCVFIHFFVFSGMKVCSLSVSMKKRINLHYFQCITFQCGIWRGESARLMTCKCNARIMRYLSLGD